MRAIRPAVLLLLLDPNAVWAQQGGRVADSAVGEVGQRETREQPDTGILPMARIDSRVQNRVQNRLRTRIDRYYDPQANAASPFDIAGDQARIAGRARPR